MITALLIGAVAVYLLAHKNNSVSGIGATRRKQRRIWKEVEAAQRAGIDLTDPNGWENNKGKLDTIMFLHEAIPNSSKSEKPTYQRYFNQLRRAYKSIAGTNLPYDESIVRNEYGDMIMTYRDYHLDELPKRAAEYMGATWEAAYLNYDAAYWMTIAAIALGRVKFVWTSKGNHRGVQQLVFGQSAPAERKARISYLASPEKGGVYPEQWAHRLWESDGNDRDDQEITNGVLEAIRTCQSVGQAQQMCVDEYMRTYAGGQPEPLLYTDVPF